MPIVGVDYFFITGDGWKKRKELPFEMTPEGEAELLDARRKGEVIKCIVIRCFNSNAIFAHVVRSKERTKRTTPRIWSRSPCCG